MSKSVSNKIYYSKNKDSHRKRMLDYYYDHKKQNYCETCMKHMCQSMDKHCQSAYHIKRQQIDDKLDTLNILEENI